MACLTQVSNTLTQILEHSTEQVGGIKRMESAALHVLGEEHDAPALVRGACCAFYVLIVPNSPKLPRVSFHDCRVRH